MVAKNGLKQAIVQVAVDRDELAEITSPLAVEAARRWGVQYFLVTEPMFNVPAIKGYNSTIFEKHQVGPIVMDLDQVMRIDDDVIIRPSCPNPFDRVIPNEFAAVREDVGNRRAQRLSEIHRAQNVLNDVSWNDVYFNSGVIIVGTNNHDLFMAPPTTAVLDRLGPFKEQTLLNWRLRHRQKLAPNEYPFHELPNVFNWMSMFGRVHDGVHIIHVAGPQKGKRPKLKALVKRWT